MIMSYRPHPTTTAAASAHSAAHCDFRAPTRSAAVLTPAPAPARRGAARLRGAGLRVRVGGSGAAEGLPCHSMLAFATQKPCEHKLFRLK